MALKAWTQLNGVKHGNQECLWTATIVAGSKAEAVARDVSNMIAPRAPAIPMASPIVVVVGNEIWVVV